MKHERIDAERLRTFSIAVFEAAGTPHDHAVRATDVLIWASLRGVDTHGIRNLKRYYLDAAGVGRRDGRIVFDAELTLDHESPTTAAFDAHSGLALSLSVQAMECAIRKARDAGVGVVTVRNSTHFGPAGYYAWMAVAHDMLGFAACGYLFPNGQAKAVLPFGGLLPMLSAKGARHTTIFGQRSQTHSQRSQTHNCFRESRQPKEPEPKEPDTQLFSRIPTEFPEFLRGNRRRWCSFL